MRRRRPRSTPFPTRRSSDLALARRHGRVGDHVDGEGGGEPPPPAPGDDLPALGRPRLRSEEHTSELQSLTNLVCRLLLEKKKTNSESALVAGPQESRL